MQRNELARMLNLYPIHYVMFRGIEEDDRDCIMLSPVCFPSHIRECGFVVSPQFCSSEKDRRRYTAHGSLYGRRAMADTHVPRTARREKHPFFDPKTRS